MSQDSRSSSRLAPHSRIAIIGGGPAGSYFALSAFQIAAQLDLPLELTLFERKDLAAPGPQGCNMCAGILSRRAVEGLAALGIALPPDVIMGRANRYQLHWGKHSIPIQPADATRQVLSVYRAGGPRLSPYPPTPGLDDFLLTQAAARGARIVRERVVRVAFDPLPQVETPARKEVFDLVVLATGVNASPPIFQNLDYTYPATETMAQDEVLVEKTPGRVRPNNTVHVYLDRPAGLIFGALIPKGHFITVSLMGRRMARDVVDQFLTLPQVMEVVGAAPARMCDCRPRVAVAPARGCYADRFVAVGDACATRLYKDGIGSAFATARAAAEVAIQEGVSRAAFAAHYAPICRSIARDNRFGRAVFAAVERSKHNRWFIRGMVRALQVEVNEKPVSRVLSQILWDLFTGDSNYEEIFWRVFSPWAMARVGKNMLRDAIEKRAAQRETDRML